MSLSFIKTILKNLNISTNESKKEVRNKKRNLIPRF